MHRDTGSSAEVYSFPKKNFARARLARPPRVYTSRQNLVRSLMIAGGDIHLQVWFDPLVSNLHIFSSVDDTVQVERFTMLSPSDIIVPSGPFPKLKRPLTPNFLLFLPGDECF